jgi:hypothetical protein
LIQNVMEVTELEGIGVKFWRSSLFPVAVTL